jgi:hypothetical protein
MAMPKHEQIIKKARELYVAECYRSNTPELADLSPTLSELSEDGYLSEARNILMRGLEREHSEYLHNVDTMQDMIRDNYTIPLDIAQCKKSNMLISGTNQVGKSRLAMAISDLLMNQEQWKVLVFDTCGNWKVESSIPRFFTVKNGDSRLDASESIVFDLSLLKPKNQKRVIEKCLEELWLLRVINPSERYTLCVFEEFQLHAKNIRGELSQNLLRIMSVGANWKIRSLGITPDLALIDPAFIRLCQQRYHFRLGNEPNAKRRFRAYYGLDWCRIVQELDVGFCIYVNKDKLEVWKIPLFQKDKTVKVIAQ